jgi:gluconate 5-dehydrogenase
MVVDIFRLDGRLALVTGSSAGIGLALARGLGQAGRHRHPRQQRRHAAARAARAVRGSRLARADADQRRQRVPRQQGGGAHMIPRKRGKIINICSVQSELGRPNIAPYTASKGAVKMLTKGMAIDWGPHGLQVNGLGPGYFKTELTSRWWPTPSSRLAGEPHAQPALGRRGRPGRRGRVPGQRRLRLRQRPHPVRGWRRHATL